MVLKSYFFTVEKKLKKYYLFDKNKKMMKIKKIWTVSLKENMVTDDAAA